MGAPVASVRPSGSRRRRRCSVCSIAGQGFGPFARFRHSISPTFGYAYAPAATVSDEFLAALGRTSTAATELVDGLSAVARAELAQRRPLDEHRGEAPQPERLGTRRGREDQAPLGELHRRSRYDFERARATHSTIRGLTTQNVRLQHHLRSPARACTSAPTTRCSRARRTATRRCSAVPRAHHGVLLDQQHEQSVHRPRRASSARRCRRRRREAIASSQPPDDRYARADRLAAGRRPRGAQRRVRRHAEERAGRRRSTSPRRGSGRPAASRPTSCEFDPALALPAVQHAGAEARRSTTASRARRPTRHPRCRSPRGSPARPSSTCRRPRRSAAA